jgi:signal transduction histidine kinase
VATLHRWRPSPFLLTVLAWTLVCMVFIAQNVAREAAARRPINWENDVFNEGMYWTAFALLSPLLVWMCRRFSLVSAPRGRHLSAHLLASPGIAALQVLLYFVLLGLTAIALQQLSAAALPAWLARRPALLVLTITAFWKYWVIVGLIHGVEYARLYAREHRAASELREQLTAAQLHQLKARLQPHFLFNALNGIAVLMRDEPERARTMLVRLSQLLRSVIDAGDEQVVPLRDEMRLVEQYLELQQMRLGDRLGVTLDVSPEAAPLPVPHFLIQPLVENAVQHGVSRSERGGAVTIRARRDDSHLVIEVVDVPADRTGPVADSPGAGIGLPTTRERLDRLYGTDYGFSIEPGDEGGTRVRLRIPDGAPAHA